jgi:hypothetical protein
VTVASGTAGAVRYGVTGRGLLPGAGGADEAATEVVAALGSAATKVQREGAAMRGGSMTLAD